MTDKAQGREGACRPARGDVEHEVADHHQQSQRHPVRNLAVLTTEEISPNLERIGFQFVSKFIKFR